MSERGLTDSQEAFVLEYLKDLNATAAAKRAGYSVETAQEQSSRLLSNVMVRGRVQELLDERASRCGIEADMILKELFRIAMLDVSKAVDSEGNFLPFDQIPEDIRKAISTVEVFDQFGGMGNNRTVVGRTRRVKFYDKIKALELLGKHLRLFTDRVEIESKVTLEDLLAQTHDRHTRAVPTLETPEVSEEKKDQNGI